MRDVTNPRVTPGSECCRCSAVCCDRVGVGFAVTRLLNRWLNALEWHGRSCSLLLMRLPWDWPPPDLRQVCRSRFGLPWGNWWARSQVWFHCRPETITSRPERATGRSCSQHVQRWVCLSVGAVLIVPVDSSVPWVCTPKDRS